MWQWSYSTMINPINHTRPQKGSSGTASSPYCRRLPMSTRTRCTWARAVDVVHGISRHGCTGAAVQAMLGLSLHGSTWSIDTVHSDALAGILLTWTRGDDTVHSSPCTTPDHVNRGVASPRIAWREPVDPLAMPFLDDGARRHPSVTIVHRRGAAADVSRENHGGGALRTAHAA
jgi:hypothetical protein